MVRKWFVVITVVLSLFVYAAGCSLPWRIVRVDQGEAGEGPGVEEPRHESAYDSGSESKPESPPAPNTEPPPETEKPNEPAGQNRAPVINAHDINIVEKGNETVALDPLDLRMYSQYIVTAGATDPDGDPLTYHWQIAGGTCTADSLDKNPLYWMPVEGGEYLLTVTVLDGRGGEATAAVHVFAHAPYGITP